MYTFTDIFARAGLHHGESLVVAVSGGADSMCLLAALADHGAHPLIVAHVNHLLRGDESDADEAFVREWCVGQGIPCHVERADVAALARERRCGIEEAARILRYDFLERVRVETGARYIVTAHTGSDLVETMLFHLIRGTKVTGMSALRERHGHILRPLLSWTRDDVLASIREHAIPYREDSSNADTRYLRNHIRREIIPHFPTVNPEFARAFRQFSEYAGELREYLDAEIRAFFAGGESFLVADFRARPVFWQRECIRYMYEWANHGTIGLSEQNI